MKVVSLYCIQYKDTSVAEAMYNQSLYVTLKNVLQGVPEKMLPAQDLMAFPKYKIFNPKYGIS